jgi:hypothetical protein
MLKKLLIGAAALALVGSTVVYAQHRHFGPHGPHGFAFNAEDMPALLDARMAALKAGLKLTSDQEKNWPAFEEAYRGLAKLRMDRFAAMHNENPPAPPANMLEGLQRRADAFSQRGAALKKLADATAPLFNSFDEGQKRRFHILAHPMGPRMAHFAWSDQRDGDRDGRFDGPHGFERERAPDFDRPRPDRPHGQVAPERLKWAEPQGADEL